jgi:hypothetical protein
MRREDAAMALRLLLCLVVALSILETPRAETSAAGSTTDDGPLVVGAFLNQREIGWLDVRSTTDGYLIPLQAFAELAGCEVKIDNGVTRLVTPLGPIDLEPAELESAEGVVYFPESVIESRLAGGVVFDTSRYALSFDLPWRPGAESSAVRVSPALVPDVTPPGFSLSTLRSDIRYTRIEDEGLFGSTWNFAGRLGPGYWRIRYENDLSGQHQLRDYAWFHRQDSWMLLAGNQRVRLHPLFNSLELTGAQAAWTNEPLDRFHRGPSPRELLPRRTSPLDSFVGYGPPAGLAVLRVDGRIVERRRIGLDGRYEFLDISIPARRASRVEVLLYDRRNPGVPVEILEETRTASEYLLSDGALIQLGGAGREGNILQERMDLQQSFGTAGFYQTRYGISDRVTVEGAVQHTGLVTQYMGGVVSRLGPTVVMSVGLGASDGNAGYSFDLEALPRPWRVLIRSLATRGGYFPLEQEDRFDHYFEWGYSRSRTLDVALVGRSRGNALEDVSYILPAVAWRPMSALFVRAWPDIEGDYRFDLNYRVQPRSNLALSFIADRGYAEFYHQFTGPFRVRASAGFGGDLADRQEAIVTWLGRGRWNPSWEAGPIVTDGELGALLGGRVRLMRGLYAQARFESHARLGDPALERTERLLFNITADLGFSGGRVAAAQSRAIGDDRGGVAGGVRVDAPEELGEFDLSGLTVLMNGQRAAATGPDGSFFVGGLRPGVYRFELESRNLPVELEPHLAAINVEVGAAAVTRLDFVVRPEYGIAGRVRDVSGRPARGVVVEVVDEAGSIRRAASTDRYGLYRIDGLPLGSYTLGVRSGFPETELPMPSSRFTIDDDFLFDMDLTLPVEIRREERDGG